MSRLGIVLGCALVLAGCGGGSEGHAASEATEHAPAPDAAADAAGEAAHPLAGLDPCVAPEEPLVAGVTLEGGAGRYRVLMVRTTEPVDSVTGSMELSDPPVGFERYRDMSVPLMGWADLPLDSVGAHVTGRVDIADPSAPGVLVLETEGEGVPPRILVRFGAEANRRDVANFEGGYTVWEVRDVGPGGFRGVWRSGVRGPEISGYFCAVRVKG